MARVYAITASLLVVLLLAGLGYFVIIGRGSDAFSSCRSDQARIAGASIGGAFTLRDEDGRIVTDKDVITGPTLIYFGYTYCPDVCPVDNARNAEAVDILARRGIDATPVFISVDPKRDTPDVLKDYTESFSPRMIGLTGSEAEVKSVTSAYHVYFRIQDPADANYLVDHSTYTYLMMPKRGFVDAYRRGASADSVASSVACYVRASRGV